ncbi:MAG: acetoin utilization protein AcuC [Fimbriimonas sp.]
MIPHFYYSDRILRYDFGPGHPLKPERLRRTIELLRRYGVEPIDPGRGRREDLLRVHDEAYVTAVEAIDGGEGDAALRKRHGFGSSDNPPFPGMWEASMAYVSATARAAEAVRDGTDLAFGIGGGLHHAHRSKASGFCIFDDPAIACDILLEKFDRVAYIDIDVHHGDGVQWIWYDDPRVLTVSIHETGRTLFPGTGFVDETGAAFTSLNIPVVAKTTGDVWLDAFERVVPDALERFEPQAIVLQLGTDTHFLDPLGHVLGSQPHWLGAVLRVKTFGVPIVAVGGGGYNLTTVPRMWASACLELAGIPYDDALPEDLAAQWGVSAFADAEPPSGGGRSAAEEVIETLRRNHLPRL